METNKRKALGRGLEQLFSNESLYVNPIDPIEEIVENTPKEDIVELNVSELRSNPYQPRKTFEQEKLVELANSIKEFGVLEPIIVKKTIKVCFIISFHFEVVDPDKANKFEVSRNRWLKSILERAKEGSVVNCHIGDHRRDIVINPIIEIIDIIPLKEARRVIRHD